VDALIGVCSNQCLFYSEHTVLSVNSWSWHGEIERDDLALGSAMMVELWTRKREMGHDDEYNLENKSSHQKSWVKLVRSHWENLHSMLFYAGTGLEPAASGRVKWLAHNTSWSHSFSWWFPPSRLISLFLVLNTAIAKSSQCSRSLHAMIKSENNVQHPLSTPYAEYCIHCVLHHPRSTVSHSQPVSHFSADHIVHNSLHSHNYKLRNE